MRPLLFVLTFLVSTSAALFGQVATPPSGTGASGDPYLIATLDNLTWLSQTSSEWGKFYEQTADINASATIGWNAGTGWMPIGAEGTPFTGTYDGNGHTISGLYINRGGSNGGALFGAASGGTISNLGVVDLNITGGNFTGGLVSFDAATITNCFSTGVVAGWGSVGGLLAYASNSPVSNCYSACSVSGYNETGGLIGECYAPVSNSYSRGDVTRVVGDPSLDVGPFVGGAWSYAILNCYSTGRVIYTGTTNPTNVGFVGQDGGVSYTGNFWDMETSLQSTTSGTATGTTTALMKTRSTFVDAGWDGAVWAMDTGINDGYPYLLSQNPGGSPLPIQLASLTAAPTGGSSVTLNWKTASETNNYGFYVERSVSNSAGFAAVSGLIPGHGTSATGFSYAYTDKSAPAGTAYYRLKQVDLDNSIHYSDAVALTTTDVAETAPIVFALSQNYPNPFNPSTEFRFTVAKTGLTTLVVYNAIGQEVARIFNGETETGKFYTARLDGASLASGVYFARLQSGSAIQMRKIVLMK